MKPYYEQSGVTIYHGDCRDVMDALAPHWGDRPFDLLLTDPPYGINAHEGIGKYGRLKADLSVAKWDAEAPQAQLLAMARSMVNLAIIWGGNYFDLPPSRKFLVWDKGAGFAGRDFAECEQAWCSWDGNAKIFRRDPLAAGDYRGKEHPTEKPVALMKWCIAQAGILDVRRIFDPFAGSGTTGVAAKDYGIEAVLIEAYEPYCEIAAKRLRQEALPLEVA